MLPASVAVRLLIMLHVAHTPYPLPLKPELLHMANAATRYYNAVIVAFLRRDCVHLF